MPVITHARVLPSQGWGSKARVMVRVANSGSEQELFSFYDDELSFSAGEFLGKTEDQGRALFFERDKQYLRS